MNPDETNTNEIIVNIDLNELEGLIGDTNILLEKSNEILIWQFSIMWLLVGLLFFILFFVSLKAGKN